MVNGVKSWFTYERKVGSGLRVTVHVAPPIKKDTSQAEVSRDGFVWQEVGEWSSVEKSQIKKGETMVREIKVQRLEGHDAVAEFVRENDPFAWIHALSIARSWTEKNPRDVRSIDTDPFLIKRDLEKGLGAAKIAEMKETMLWMIPNSESHEALKDLAWGVVVPESTNESSDGD